MVSLMRQLLNAKQMTRPRTLYFFSDMQFHAPELQVLPANCTLTAAMQPYFKPQIPPLLSVIHAWRDLIGPVDVVLWNMASYDNAPVPATIDNVLMLAGFDANTFGHVAKWQAQETEGSSKGDGGKIKDVEKGHSKSPLGRDVTISCW